MKTILVIGATGHFGGRICHRLLDEPNTTLMVASRSHARAQALATQLNRTAPGQPVLATAIDQSSAGFERDLKKISPDIVVHTAGPYQGQSYRVAQACIAVGSHYIDLADGRKFVEEFGQLDEQAKQSDVLLVTGASTLPGLSSAVVDYYKDDFYALHAVEMSIAPAHQTPRGKGTIAAVLSYCGKPIHVLEQGSWVKRHGWQDLRAQQYPVLGKRKSAVCDVPDITLLPKYLPDVQTVTFHAAIEAPWEQFSLWAMSWLTRLGIIKSWIRFVPLFNFVSEKLIRLGSDKGGMHIHLQGIGADGQAKKIVWHLLAKNNHGPEIPCTPAIVLARKLVRGEIAMRGATPCLGLMSLADFTAETESLEISWHTGNE